MGYSPDEGDGEERDRFWNDMNRTLDNVGNGYRLCILGDLNGWIRDMTRAGITVAFGVPGENDNGRRVVEFCTKGNCVWVTHFKHINLHMYTRVESGQDCVEIKGMLDLVLVKRDMLRYVQDGR